MSAAIAERRSRRGGSSSRRELRSVVSDEMLPALHRRLPLNEPMKFEQIEPMKFEQIERIDAASMAILEDVGVIFRDPTAIEDWRRAGADIREDQRCLPRRIASF